MTRTFAIFVAALALACGALWARDRDEPSPVTPVPSAVPVSPAPQPADEPVGAAAAAAPEPSPEPEPEPAVDEPETEAQGEQGCGCGAPMYEDTESTGAIDATVSLYYRCRGSPLLADEVSGEGWKGYPAAPGESVCFANVDVFGGCETGPEHQEALMRLQRITGPSPILRVTNVATPPEGEQVWAWSMPYELEGADTASPVQRVHPEWAKVLGEVTGEAEIFHVDRYDGMIYGVVTAPDKDGALERLRRAAEGSVTGDALPSNLLLLSPAQGPARRCPAP